MIRTEFIGINAVRQISPNDVGTTIERSVSRVDFRRFPINTETLREFRYCVSAFGQRYVPKLVHG